MRFGFYMLTSLNGMAVAWNIFLKGNTFTESHSVDKKPFVAEFTSGLSIAVSRINLSFANIYQTKEFEGQRDNQKYGSITCYFSF
jgi:lipid A 3-O-deacylase